MSLQLLLWTASLIWSVSGQSPTCQLQSGGDCVCGDPNVHSYCGSSSCAPENRLFGGIQSPPDYCRNYFRFADDHILPEEWELVFDFYDYQSSVGSVFLEREFDNDTSTATIQDSWIQRGGICQRDLRACAFALGQQDNWLFSTHIKYPPGSTTAGGGYSTEVYLNISYRFTKCVPARSCFNNFVTLYRYDTNSIASETARTSNNNYLSTPLFGQRTENTDSRFQQSGRLTNNVVRSFTTPGTTGFHFGIRDTGTCGRVLRIFFYYTPCKKLQDGLVNYPELVRPPEGSPPNVGEACCALNSHNTTFLSFRAYSDGRCERNVRCVCDAGYRLNAAGTGCDICHAGTYQSHSQCLPCPMNTVTDAVGAGVCECLPGYDRVRGVEGPEVDCTAYCSGPRDLRVNSVMDTTVTVRWTRPEVTGRDDFYYTLQYSDPDTIGAFLPTPPLRIDNQALSVSYTIRGLQPNTAYTIRVTSHNGVTDQDSENAALRIVNIQFQTMEGAPTTPLNVRNFCEVVVWGPPAQPNGVITGYDVRFSSATTFLSPISKAPSESYHVVNSSDVRMLIGTIHIQVRARTSAGAGPYSVSVNYIDCTTVTPSACPPLPAVRFMLGGKTYINGDIILITDIGEGDDALLCVTDSTTCCSRGIGNFYYPDGTSVEFFSTTSFYRNRASQVVRLNRRGNELTAPTGRYRCEIPDSSGTTQNIYVNIIYDTKVMCPPTPPPVTCPPAPPPVTCPPAPPPVTCPPAPPPVTCPPAPPPVTCPPAPPPVTCPPTPPSTTCPMCPDPTPCPSPTPCPPEPAVRFMLYGFVYVDGDTVLITDIGEGDDAALLCVTDSTTCCQATSTTAAAGEFYYPDGRLVNVRASGDSFYRNRGDGFIRLNRRNGALSSLGRYRCDIPDSQGVTRSIFINIASTMPPTCPTCPTQITCETCTPPPTCPPPPTCETSIPPPTCPPPPTCETNPLPPTCPPHPTCEICSTVIPTLDPPLRFTLQSRTYLDGDTVLITDIGEDDAALLCVTDSTTCCLSPVAGEFYYPDGGLVGVRASGDSFYRNRGDGFIRLNRRNGALSPLGRYRCEIPDSHGVIRSIYINLASTMPPIAPVTCPEVSCPTYPSPSTCPPPVVNLK